MKGMKSHDVKVGKRKLKMYKFSKDLNSLILIFRDEIITKAKLAGDDDTKRKLDLDMDELQDQDDPEEDSSQDDDVFYDTTTGDRDEE